MPHPQGRQLGKQQPNEEPHGGQAAPSRPNLSQPILASVNLMAEVFGIAAGAAGFVSLLVQIIGGIDTLRDISNRADKAPAELSSLMNELICLQRLMKEVIDKPPHKDDCVLQMCHASCEDVVRGLEKLEKRLPIESEGMGKPKVLKIFALRHWKEDVEVLQRSIQGAKINLILVNTYQTSVRLKEILLVNQIHMFSPPVSTQEGKMLTAPPLPRIPASYSSEESTVASQDLACILPPKSRRYWNCAEKHCSCSCHRIARTTRRFWALEYTPLDIFRQACDNKSCNVTKYGGTFRFALSQLGVRWSGVIQFHLHAAPGKFLFRPAFEVERIVPYTSPGFEILWRCQLKMITIEEARDRLVDLYRSDPTFKDHINPGGKSYIEELVRKPWVGSASRLEQYTLLELFMREFGMTRGTQSTIFLARCANWSGEGPYLQLLEILLELGFDATLIDSPHAQDWPEPFLTDCGWDGPGLMPDPFFIEYQSMLLRDNQGFAGMTPLHEAILLGSLESVNKWIPCSDKDERNFLGQTPIHLAISNSRHLRALINAGHDLNSVDNYGITPLMYAAATNQEECLRVLLEAGANPFIRDTRYQRTFMQYAALSGHWNLILIVLYHMKAVAEKKTAESWAKHATLLYYVFYPDYHQDREVSSQQLLATCGSVNFTFDHYDKELENSTLLHYVRSANDIEALLEQGFRLVNHVNSTGQHALMRAVLNQRNPDMVRRLLDAGAEINLKDNSHYTTLYYVLNKLQRDCEEFAAMDIVRILLANGADVLCRDSCRCPCSPNGCLPSALLQHAVCENFFSASLPVWSLEWLSLVLEYRGKSEAEEILLLFIRKGKFDEMEMTHVCCTRNHISIFFRRPSMSDEDIDEILDEESEFVQILEDEMALSSAKVYETLLDDWMLQIKASLEKSCEQAIEFNKRFPCDKEPHQNKRLYLVDYRNDRFTTKTEYHPNPKDPAREVTSSIAEYILWMEHEYHCGSTSGLDSFPREDWYFRRMSWLRRLVNILEISTGEIADSMRDMWTRNKESKYGPIHPDVEESIKHFLSWGEIQEEHGFSPISKVET